MLVAGEKNKQNALKVLWLALNSKDYLKVFSFINFLFEKM